MWNSLRSVPGMTDAFREEFEGLHETRKGKEGKRSDKTHVKIPL